MRHDSVTANDTRRVRPVSCSLLFSSSAVSISCRTAVPVTILTS